MVANIAFMVWEKHAQDKLTALVSKRLAAPVPLALAPQASPATTCPKAEVDVGRPFSLQPPLNISNEAPPSAPHRHREGALSPWRRESRSSERSRFAASLWTAGEHSAGAAATAPAAVTPIIKAPADQSTLWTWQSLHAKNLALLVTLAPAQAGAKVSWTPELLASSDKEGEPLRVTGHQTANALHTLRLELAPLVHEQDATLDLSLSAAAVGAKPGPPSMLHLASLHDLAATSGPQTFYLNPGPPAASTLPAKNWTPLPRASTSGDAPLVLQLTSASLLPRLAPLLLNAQALTMAAGSGQQAPGGGTCFLRLRKVVACAGGPALNKELLLRLGQLLQADLQFHGTAADFLGQPQDVSEMRQLMTSAPRQIYVYEQRKNYQPYQVSGDFLQRAKGAYNYLADGSSLLFTGAVELRPIDTVAH